MEAKTSSRRSQQSIQEVSFTYSLAFILVSSVPIRVQDLTVFSGMTEARILLGTIPVTFRDR